MQAPVGNPTAMWRLPKSLLVEGVEVTHDSTRMTSRQEVGLCGVNLTGNTLPFLVSAVWRLYDRVDTGAQWAFLGLTRPDLSERHFWTNLREAGLADRSSRAMSEEASPRSANNAGA
jgi:hypothetical protein